MSPSPGARRETSRLAWTIRRLARMSPSELCWRVEMRLRQEAWIRRRPGVPNSLATARRGGRPIEVPHVPPGADPRRLPPEAARALVRAATQLLEGRAVVLGAVRHDMHDPAWSLDPRSGLTYPLDRPAFRVDLHAPGDPRQVKQVWEISRHHHLTVLASAWWVTGDERYASAVSRQLRSWWAQNPVMAGVNWTSGIELGIRLISWIWIRRLLDGWADAPALFERNPVALAQVYWHQRYLRTFASRGSSANNHVIAEAAGCLAAGCAFPWFPESARWRKEARTLLARELARNTFPDGVNREQAFEYHNFVAELVMAAAVEVEAAGLVPGDDVWTLLCRMLDVVAAALDRSGRPPRQGDGDDGRALVLDDPASDRWRSLLATGSALFGAPGWWPPTTPDVRSTLVAALVGHPVRVDGRPPNRPSHFPDAGMTILRSPPDAGEELWCRCDGGPHGFLSIAAHAHADALSFELRHDGVDVLVDPGTYCYQGDPAWRRYFRSTLAHNTIELDGEDQSVAAGPFLWIRHARTELLEMSVDEVGPKRWSAEHHGYDRLGSRARHARRIVLDPDARSVVIVDHLCTTRPHALRLVFHLGPSVEVGLDRNVATLCWAHPSGRLEMATVLLPAELEWVAHHGESDPPLGWYSPSFGEKVPSTTLVGSGRVRPARMALRSEIHLGRPAGGAPRAAELPALASS